MSKQYAIILSQSFYLASQFVNYDNCRCNYLLNITRYTSTWYLRVGI